ncbi:metacaspase-1 [uncultured Gammaproteobacteria bacterium]
MSVRSALIGCGLAAVLLAGTSSLALAASVTRSLPKDVYALVIGIDDYQHVTKLQGAVNDARDIAAALKKAGARDVRLLLDEAADHDTVLKAWDELLAKAKPGSTLVLSYAGHGSQMPELIAGSEEDGLDEFWVLAGFSEHGPGVHQRLIDNEVALMLQKASKLNVLVISDSCHSGTMTRGLDPRGERLPTRAATFGPMDADPLVPPDAKGAAAEQAPQPHVTFLAAVSESELAPEVKIDGSARGALSWSFARALEGAADADGDGVTTKEELERFVRENIRMKLKGRQHPQVTRGGLGQDPALPGGQGGQGGASGAADASGVGLVLPQTLPLRLVNLPAGIEPAMVYQSIVGAAQADDKTAGRFTWDVASGDMIDPGGDVIVNVGADPETGGKLVQGVIDKWRLLKALEADAERRSLTVKLDPGDRRYRENEQVSFQVGGNRDPYFTLINLASDGTLNFLYPLNDGKIKDAPTIPLGGPYTLKLQVTPPFGADHFIAIASAQPLEALHRALREIDGKQEPSKVGALLSQHLTGQTYQLGVHGVYSGR